MSIQSVSNNTSSYVSPLSLNTDTTSAPATDTSSTQDTGTRVSLSGPSELFSKLQKLEASDPSKAKDVLHALADKVREQASSQGGEQATHLNALADKLDKAADSGDLSGLSPAQHGGRAHGHHHHHGGGGGGGEGVTSANDADAAVSNPAASAYSKQASQASDDHKAGKALFDTLNAMVDQLTA